MTKSTFIKFTNAVQTVIREGNIPESAKRRFVESLAKQVKGEKRMVKEAEAKTASPLHSVALKIFGDTLYKYNEGVAKAIIIIAFSHVDDISANIKKFKKAAEALPEVTNVKVRQKADDGLDDAYVWTTITVNKK